MKKAVSFNKNIYIAMPAISILIVFAVGFLWIRPTIDSILQKQTMITEEQDKKTKLDTKLATLNELSKRRTELLAELTSVNVALPTQKDVPTLIIQLQKIAQESDVQIQGIQLSPGKLINDTATTAKTGPEISLNVAIRGNYEAIKTFIGKVYKGKRLINMDSIVVTSGSADDGSLTTALTMNTYYQPIPQKADSTDPVAELTSADKEVYDVLQGYTSYQLDGQVFVPAPTPAPSSSASPVSSEAPETSASATP